jgi:arylsulfatase A-like enzyme
MRHVLKRWGPASRRVLLVSLGLASVLPGCTRARPPSILLFVLDTTRVDAVSAYGRVADTTPTVDGLAAAGLRYTQAYAQAPWTLPSHATLFTGLLPSEHGVGWRRPQAPDSLSMLAEKLHDAGYETMGVSENSWISPDFNMTQGFEQFTSPRALGDVPDVRETLARWARTRDPKRSFFLFVNVVDSHSPYTVRAVNRFLPPGVSTAAARAIPQGPHHYFCATESHDRELAALWGLYLGDVAVADAKLGAVLDVLRDAGLASDLITVVTADHGEHFGEHRLVGHQFSLRQALLHVPLVVHGLSGVAPAVVEAPVQLADVVPSILGWTGMTVPGGLSGQALPVEVGAGDGGRAVIGEHIDYDPDASPDAPSIVTQLRQRTGRLRAACTPQDRVFGDMRALLKHPFKLLWYERYSPQLYDLSADDSEVADLAPARPALVADLATELSRRTSRSRADATEPVPTLLPSPEVQDRLRALGYIDDAEPAPVPRP